jgi:hypothetical protein
VAVEHAPQGLGAAQPAAFGHHVERVVTRLEASVCRLKPDPLHEPSRALTDIDESRRCAQVPSSPLPLGCSMGAG